MATLSGGPFTPLVQLHGALFTAWVVLFIVQTALIADHRVAVHRRLGIAGAALAAAMLVAGTLTAIASAARDSAPVGVDPLAFLAIPIFDMVLFATFVTAALARRRDKEAHKRLMLLAYFSIVRRRWRVSLAVLPLGPPAFFGLTFLFLVAAVAYDFRRGGRCIGSTSGAELLIVLSVPVRLAISGTGAWRAFAHG